MCKCSQNIRTPYCGRGKCLPPPLGVQVGIKETFNEKIERLGLMESTVTNMVDEIDSLRKQVATQTTEAFTTNPEQERICVNCEWNDKGESPCLDCGSGNPNFQFKQEIK